MTDRHAGSDLPTTFPWADFESCSPLRCGASLQAVGFWVRARSMMRRCQPYGHFCDRGKPFDRVSLRRLLNMRPQQVDKLMDELVGWGVFKRTPGGLIYCPRLVDAAFKRDMQAGARAIRRLV
jgi:hypothetical protein